jgi:hypothetical protein
MFVRNHRRFPAAKRAMNSSLRSARDAVARAIDLLFFGI